MALDARLLEILACPDEKGVALLCPFDTKLHRLVTGLGAIERN